MVTINRETNNHDGVVEKKYEMLTGQKVLVTGASGFIGMHLCRRLLKEGADVNAVSRVMRTDRLPGIRWWFGDLTDIATVRQLFSRIQPDFVFHLAGYPVSARGLEHVLPSFHSNLMTNVNVLTAAREYSCKRALVAGSFEEADLGDRQGVPSSPYAVAKLSSSMYARMFHLLYQLPVVNLRIHMVYGPGQSDTKKLIPYVILNLLRGKAPTILSGHRKVDWVYVDDVVEAMFTTVSTRNTEGATIDIGTGRNCSIREIVEHLRHLIDPSIHPVYSAPSGVMEREKVANVESTLSTTGWGPRVSLEKGLELTVDWYRTRWFDKKSLVI
jgi:nucleoside-diphosphate-sugar epimerase